MCIYIYCYITYMLHCMYGVPHFESFMYDSPCTISQYDAVCIYIIYPKTRDSYDMTSSIYSTITIFRGLYIYIYICTYCIAYFYTLNSPQDTPGLPICVQQRSARQALPIERSAHGGPNSAELTTSTCVWTWFP